MKYAVIVIAGYRCAGKSVAARLLRAAGYPVLSMGTLLGPLGFRHYFNDEPLPVDLLLQRYGSGRSVFPVFANTLKAMVRRHGLLFVDSAKTAADVDALRTLIPGAEVRTLFLECEFDERFRRFVRRGRERNRSEEALRAADRRLRESGLERLRGSPGWVIDAASGAAAALQIWLDASLPLFVSMLGAPPPVRSRAMAGRPIVGWSWNRQFASVAQDALHRVAITGSLGPHSSEVEAALADAKEAETDWHRLNALRHYEWVRFGASRPMRVLMSSYERAIRERLRQGRQWNHEPAAVGRGTVASPFLASLTPVLLRALGQSPRDYLLAASASDAAHYDRIIALARERLEMAS